MKSLLDLYEYPDRQVVRISKELITLRLSEQYSPKGKLLRRVQGIGSLIALKLLARVIDIERFKTAQERAFYIGLTHLEYSTAQCVRHGRIAR